MRGAEGAGRGRDGASRVAWEERCCGTRCGGQQMGGLRGRERTSAWLSEASAMCGSRFAVKKVKSSQVRILRNREILGRLTCRVPISPRMLFGHFTKNSQRVSCVPGTSPAKARKSTCQPRCRTSRSSRSGRSSSRATSPMSRSRSSRAGAGRAVSTRAIAAGTCCRRRSNHVCASAAGQASGRAGQGRAPGFASRDAWQRTELSAAEGLTIGPRRLALGGR